MARFETLDRAVKPTFPCGGGTGCWNNATNNWAPCYYCTDVGGGLGMRGNRFPKGQLRRMNQFQDSGGGCGCGCSNHKTNVAPRTKIFGSTIQLSERKNRLVHFPMSNLSKGLMRFGQTRMQRASTNKFRY